MNFRAIACRHTKNIKGYTTFETRCAHGNRFLSNTNDPVLFCLKKLITVGSYHSCGIQYVYKVLYDDNKMRGESRWIHSTFNIPLGALQSRGALHHRAERSRGQVTRCWLVRKVLFLPWQCPCRNCTPNCPKLPSLCRIQAMKMPLLSSRKLRVFLLSMTLIFSTISFLVLFQAKTNRTFSIEASGRMGNLMFEYALVVSLCSLSGVDVKRCARFTKSASQREDLPLTYFLDAFNIDPSNWDRPLGTVVEHLEDGKDTRFKSSILELCQDTNSHLLKGYFQSYKYFSPHAQKIIRETFTFNRKITGEAIKFWTTTVNEVGKNREIVCMACRRGDKTKEGASSIYDTWALGSKYYLKAIERFKRDSKEIAVIVFLGGSFQGDDENGDYAWLEQNIINKYSQDGRITFIAGSKIPQDPAVVMKSISLCSRIIVAASSFSWWAAYLSNATNVVAPGSMYSEERDFSVEDYYPSGWDIIMPDT